MGPKPVDERCDHDLFRTELIRLGDLIDWQAFADEWSPQSVSTTGCLELPTRLMAALLYVKHVYAFSDEDTAERWSENPCLLWVAAGSVHRSGHQGLRLQARKPG